MVRILQLSDQVTDLKQFFSEWNWRRCQGKSASQNGTGEGVLAAAVFVLTQRANNTALNRIEIRNSVVTGY